MSSAEITIEQLTVVPEVFDPSATLTSALVLEQRDFFAQFPSLASFEEEVDLRDEPQSPILEGIAQATLMSRIEHRAFKRQRIADHSARFVEAGARYLESFEDVDAAEASLRQLMMDEYRGTVFDTPHLESKVALMQKQVSVLYQSRAELRDIAESVVAPIPEQLQTDVDARYTLLKGLTNHISGENVDTENGGVVLAMLLMYTHPETVATVKSDLESGAYDMHIAQDVVSYVCGLSREQRQQLPNGFGRVGRIVNILSRLVPEVSALQVLTTFDDWAHDTKSFVIDSRQALMRELETTIRTVQLDQGLTLGEQVSVDKELRSALSAMVTAALHEIAVSDTESKHTRVRAGVESRRRMRERQKREQIEQGVEGTNDVQEREPLTLVGLRPVATGGFESAEGHIEKLIEGYLDDHQNVANIADEITELIDHIKKEIDFSAGRASGVKKLQQAKIKIGHQTYDVMEYKPLHVHGLSTRSHHMRKFRMMFVRLDGDTLGVLKMFDRDKENEAFRSIGIGVSSRNR